MQAMVKIQKIYFLKQFIRQTGKHIQLRIEVSSTQKNIKIIGDQTTKV